jgi:hypothetical protein
MTDPVHRPIVVEGLVLVLFWCVDASAQKYGEVDEGAPPLKASQGQGGKAEQLTLSLVGSAPQPG